MPNPLQGRRQRIARSLTLVAGFVDVVGYVVLYRIYTANMTGNTVAMGLHWAEGNWGRGLARGWPILVFVAGVAISGIIFRMGERHGWRHMLPSVLAAEAVLLVLFVAVGEVLLRDGRSTAPSTAAWVGLAAISGVAMGLQNGSLSASGTLTLYTTHVTGILTKTAEEAVNYLFWLRDRTRGRGRGRWKLVLRLSPRQENFRETKAHLGLWVNYLIGGTFGAFLFGRFGVPALFAPALVLALLVVTTWRG